jgi:hypothetical protein
MPMDSAALERAQSRIAGAAAGEPQPADLAAALERSRTNIEGLAAAAAELETQIPVQVGHAVREGLRTEVLPVARHIAEIHGLLNQAVRRLERLEGQLLAERKARVDDLALLVELMSSSWRSVDARLARLERQQEEIPVTGADPVRTTPAPEFDAELPSQGGQSDAIAERTGSAHRGERAAAA